MPITGNVAWGDSLTDYKGRDTSHFVTVVAAAATTCGACGLELLPEEILSLVVDITDLPTADPSTDGSFVEGDATSAVLRRAPALSATFGGGPVPATHTPCDGWRVYEC